MAEIKDCLRITEKIGYISSLEFYNDSYFIFKIERHIVRELAGYVIHLNFDGEGWFRIKGIDLVADGGNRITLTDSSPRRVGRYQDRSPSHRKYSDFGTPVIIDERPDVAVTEQLFFDLQNNVVQLLKNCSTLLIYVNGDSGTVPIAISKKAAGSIKDFLVDHPLIMDFDIRSLEPPADNQGSQTSSTQGRGPGIRRN